jgi:beta-lactamase regulating signal transducer with metallopeptidase domain
MSILLYFLKVILCSGILFGYYHLFLRNKRFHHYNRFYLLGALVLSLVLPLFKIPVFNEDSGTLNQVVYRTAQVITVSPVVAQASPTQEASTLFTAGNLVWTVYGLGILVLLFMLGRSLGYIRKISQRYPFERVNDLKFYQTQEPGTPFSFFRSIFWNDALNFNSQQGQQIFRHELFHVQQKHTADILLAEIITMLCWFNPFFYLIKKELKAIHEFLADQYAASGSNRYQYAELLVEQVMASRAASLAHPFFQHQLKRRITMITQLNQTKYGYWSRVMVLPLSITLFFSLALYAGENKQSPTLKQDNTDRFNIASVTDTAPQPYIKVQKWKQAQATAPTKEEKEFFFVEERFKGSELQIVREKQELLQKILKQNKTKDEHMDIVLQKELNDLKMQEKQLQAKREFVLKEKIVKNDVRYYTDDKAHYYKDDKTRYYTDDKSRYYTDDKTRYYKDDKTGYYTDEDHQKLQTELKQLSLLKKELEAGNDPQKGERLKKIDLQLQAIQDYQKNVVGVPSNFEYREDTTIRTLQRFFNKNFRYPKDMIENDGQGSVWYSFKLDESGKPVDYEVFDKAPTAVEGKIWEIVIVGYSKQTGNTISAENLQQQMKNEVLRIAAKNTTPFREGTKVTPARYYFKATFKLQKED